MTLTTEQKATNADTYEHIDQVMRLLGHAQVELMRRQFGHDRSKLRTPEVEIFTEHGPKLKGSTYGSPEYMANLQAMGPALQHHYSACRHHPEHYPNGISGMNLFDILEMLIDWYAATKRHSNGDIRKSLEISSTRFNIDPQLLQVMENTIPWLVGSMFEPCTRSQVDMQPIESTALICSD
ncbi:hypothetical protein [Microcoleus phage My-WqHQDG]|nr:hypothetical protein [Microcoleus phage My-WqHQDG]